MANYSDILRHPKWQRKRTEVLQRDNFTCTQCGDTETELHVHHLEYKGNPWDVSIDKLKTLCETCPAEEHGLNISNSDLAVNKLLEIKKAICEPLKKGVPGDKELQILSAAMKIDSAMIRIRRVNG